MSNKELVIEAVRRMPDDSSLEQIHDEIAHLADVRNGKETLTPPLESSTQHREPDWETASDAAFLDAAKAVMEKNAELLRRLA